VKNKRFAIKSLQTKFLLPAKVTLTVDGKKVVQGNILRTVPKRFSADETLDVGEDFGTPVTRAYYIPFTFKGKLEKVTVDLKE
jgi:arylsulfatase